MSQGPRVHLGNGPLPVPLPCNHLTSSLPQEGAPWAPKLGQRLGGGTGWGGWVVLLPLNASHPPSTGPVVRGEV